MTENWQALLKEREYNDLLLEWNQKINLVSRKKTEIFDLIEDSKLFFGAIDLKPGLKILDLGTGGGIPGIVIKINYPETEITFVDSIQKKINVVTDIIKKMKLENAEAVCTRAEELSRNEKYTAAFDYVVARSVAPLQDLAKWSKDLIKPGGKLVTVKGGDISGEIQKTKKQSYVKGIVMKDSNDKKIITVMFS